jgi:hypothetical protein
VIDHGVTSGLSPEQFSELVRAAGIEKLYKECKSSGASKDALSEKQREELIKAAFPDREDAPACFDKALGDGTDDRLVVVRGDGTFFLRVILDHSQLEIDQLLCGIARKRLAR